MRKPKVRSGNELRDRLTSYLFSRGASLVSHSAHNDVLGCVIGGDLRLPLAKGALVVHLPSDDVGHGFSLNTRFTDGATHPGANPYSGKWNFSCYDDEDTLYAHFTRELEVHIFRCAAVT